MEGLQGLRFCNGERALLIKRLLNCATLRPRYESQTLYVISGCFSVFHHLQKGQLWNNANNATHCVKLSKKRRENFKRNYCIIKVSPRVIIKAIIIIMMTLNVGHDVNACIFSRVLWRVIAQKKIDCKNIKKKTWQRTCPAPCLCTVMLAHPDRELSPSLAALFGVHTLCLLSSSPLKSRKLQQFLVSSLTKSFRSWCV